MNEPAARIVGHAFPRPLNDRCHLDLQQGEIREAYRLFTASQYVYVLLGVQGTPHPEMPVPAADQPDCLPADVLRDPRFQSIGKAEREELRQVAIVESSLRRDLSMHLATGLPPEFHPDPIEIPTPHANIPTPAGLRAQTAAGREAAVEGPAEVEAYDFELLEAPALGGDVRAVAKRTERTCRRRRREA